MTSSEAENFSLAQWRLWMQNDGAIDYALSENNSFEFFNIL